MLSLASIGTAALFMIALGVVLAAILAIVSQKLFVYEYPRIDAVDEMLPQAQCGVPGCRPFAEACRYKRADAGTAHSLRPDPAAHPGTLDGRQADDVGNVGLDSDSAVGQKSGRQIS